MINIELLLLQTRHSGARQKGFGIPGALGAMALMTFLAVGLEPTLAYWRATPRVNQAAAHMQTISQGAAHYVKDHYAELTDTLPLDGAAATITLQTLRDTGYISPALSDENPYGQNYSLRVRYVTQGTGANLRQVIEPLVVTQGGHAISDKELLRIAGKLDAGGTIRASSPAEAIGNNGGWEAPLANFGGTPGAGHLAVGMFFSDAGMIADYLYRSSVPGRPEVNRMNTAIDMNAKNIDRAGTVQTEQVRLTAANGQSMWMQNDSGKLNWIHDDLATELASLDAQGNFKATGRLTAGEFLELEGTAVEGSACPKDGLVSRNLASLLLFCQSGTWKRVGGFKNLRSALAVNAAYPAYPHAVQAVALCSATEVVVSGGGSCASASAKVHIIASHLSGNGWLVMCQRDLYDTTSDYDVTTTAQANCAER